MEDDDLKDYIARQSSEFKIIRDVAFATKHGRLTHPTPRLVRSANEMSSEALLCGLMVCGDALGAHAVFIVVDNNRMERSWVLLQKVETFTEQLLADLYV